MNTTPVQTYNKYLKSLVLSLHMVLAILLSSGKASGQTTGTRPKLGLVLSGGGSHGIAHVGVLKVMEEAGLRPDIITGTSMGSIIGGFYSIGYSSDSLVKILKAMDWDLLLSNKIPQNKIFFTEKKYFDNSIMSLPLLSRKVRLPSGLISGQQIENSLSYYAWPAATINDFRKLPIPFTCVSADLITVRKVDMSSGYLADAMRASSAIPTVFAPIKIDTALLSDGGLINNFPATEAKDLGADIIIGSYAGFHPKSEDELNSIPGIIQQIGFSRSMEEFGRQKKLVDILVSPLVKPYQILDFKQVDSIVAIGYRAALPFKEKFRRLADSLNMLGRQETPRYILDNQFLSFDRIRIEGNSIIPDGQVLGILDISPGQKVSKQMLYDRIELLYGMNWFEKVKYRIVPRSDSLILELECSEKPKMMLYGSGHYDNSLGSGVIVSIFIKNIFTQGSEFKVDSYIGQYYRVAMSVSQYLGRNQKFGITAHLLTDNTLLPVLTLRGESGAWKSTNLLTGMNINRILGLNHMLSLSFDFENRFLIPRYISRTGIKSFDYNLISAAFNYQVNSLDNRHFPEHGSLASVYGGFSDFFSGHIKKGSIVSEYNKSKPGEFSFGSFYTLKADWEQHLRLSSHTTMSLRSNLLYLSDCDSISSQDNFFLAGGTSALNSRSVAMYGFHPCEIPVKQLATFGMGLDWRIGKDMHVEVNGNFGAIREADRVSGYSLLAGYGAGLGYMSIIGPIRVGLMHGIYSREKYFSKIKGYISMGFSF